jgi:phosphoenolpyruvate---glycerone phosphotransferase subunit DhaL
MTDAITGGSLSTGLVYSWVDNFILEFGRRSVELTELDRRAGDGDFGTNLAGPLELAQAQLAAGTQETAKEVFDAVAHALVRSGGTSGPLLGAWFRELGRASGGATAIDLRTLADGAEAGVEIVQRLGGASPGDRTMVDAMVPAAEALRRAHSEGASLSAALAAAAAAATAGARGTIDMVGRRGRASYVGESARGAEDPGAVTIAMFFAAGSALTTTTAGD